MTHSGPPTSGQVADFYDHLGPLLSMVWDENFHFGYWESPDDQASVAEATDRLTDVLVEELDARPHHRVLDLGCGVGKPAFRLARTTGATVVGISINRAQVAEANARAAEEGLQDQLVFHWADAMDLPFEDASFDRVFALESVIHMERPRALREMARVLAPGGRVALTDLTAPEGVFVDEGKLSSLVELRHYPRLLADAGFDRHRVRDITPHTARTLRLVAENLTTHREEFERIHQVNLEDLVKSTASSIVAAADVGCLIAVAHTKAR